VSYTVQKLAVASVLYPRLVVGAAAGTVVTVHVILKGSLEKPRVKLQTAL
jgi:hypothetical protein